MVINVSVHVEIMLYKEKNLVNTNLRIYTMNRKTNVVMACFITFLLLIWNKCIKQYTAGLTIMLKCLEFSFVLECDKT